MKRSAFKPRQKPLKRSGFRNPSTRSKSEREAYLNRTKRPATEFKAKNKRGLSWKSKRQKEREARYWPVRDKFLAENVWCEFCLIEGRGNIPSSEVHHRDGRGGESMFDPNTFHASCRSCRTVPHDEPVKWSRYGKMPSIIAERYDLAQRMKAERVKEI